MEGATASLEAAGLAAPLALELPRTVISIVDELMPHLDSAILALISTNAGLAVPLTTMCADMTDLSP